MMTQPMIEQLSAEDYAFFLSYGVQNDTELQEQELRDQLMDQEEWIRFQMYLLVDAEYEMRP